MHWLFLILKDRDEPPTPEEIDIASGRRKVDGEYIQKLKTSSENIKKAFQSQQARAIVSKISPSFQMHTTYYFMTGAMGPGQIRATSNGMGHRM